MRLAVAICRYLLGLIFTVFGANGFVHFLGTPPPMPPDATQFMTAAAHAHFTVVIFLLQYPPGSRCSRTCSFRWRSSCSPRSS